MKRVVAILSLFLSCPAAANWQYTQWDMRPAAVTSASGNRTTAISQKESNYHTSPGSGVRPLLKAPHASGQLKFNAYFYFKDGSDLLKQVTLNAIDPEDNLIVIGSLTQKYGSPLEDRSTNDPIKLVVLVWQTGTDQIMYSQIGDSAGSIEYTPRLNSNTQGL